MTNIGTGFFASYLTRSTRDFSISLTLTLRGHEAANGTIGRHCFLKRLTDHELFHLMACAHNDSARNTKLILPPTLHSNRQVPHAARALAPAPLFLTLTSARYVCYKGECCRRAAAYH